MKNLLMYAFLAFGLMLSSQLFAQQGIGTNQPDKSAALDIVSNQRGLLIPRFGIPDLQAPGPVTSPAHALLVFNDGSQGTDSGFYWWDENANNNLGAWIAVTGEPGNTSNIQIIGKDPIHVVFDQGNNEWEIGMNVGNDGDVLVTDSNGDVVWTPIGNFMSSAIVGENGITTFIDSNTGDQIIQLGGALNKATTLTTDVNNTLAIDSLQAADEPNKIVVAENTGGVLRTITRSLQADVSADYTVSTALADYSAYVQEVNLYVDINDISGSDITIILPDAVSATGQVINVKLSEGAEANYYLNINDSNGNLTYGALPHQAWIFKSNGTNWQIVGKN